MANATTDDLPVPLQRDLVGYAAHFHEWKRMNNYMNRIDKALKDWMTHNNVDHLETNELTVHMTHPTRYIVDQSLIPDIHLYKVNKTINVCTVVPKMDPETESM